MRQLAVLFALHLTASIQRDLEYRAGWWSSIVQSLLALGASLTSIALLLQHTDSIGGWTFSSAMAIVGTYMVIEPLTAGAVLPSLGRLPAFIQTGALDFLLLKPVNAQFLLAIGNFRLWDCAPALVGFAFVLYAMGTLGVFSLANLLGWLGLSAAALLIVHAICMILCTCAFWILRIDNLPRILLTTLQTGRYPVTAFPAPVRVVLATIAPVYFITNVPAAAALGSLSFEVGATAIVLAIVLLVLSHLFWKRGLRSYASMSA